MHQKEYHILRFYTLIDKSYLQKDLVLFCALTFLFYICTQHSATM